MSQVPFSPTSVDSIARRRNTQCDFYFQKVTKPEGCIVWSDTMSRAPRRPFQPTHTPKYDIYVERRHFRCTHSLHEGWALFPHIRKSQTVLNILEEPPGPTQSRTIMPGLSSCEDLQCAHNPAERAADGQRGVEEATLQKAQK